MSDLDQLAAITGAILLGLSLVALLTPREQPTPIDEPRSNVTITQEQNQ